MGVFMSAGWRWNLRQRENNDQNIPAKNWMIVVIIIKLLGSLAKDQLTGTGLILQFYQQIGPMALREVNKL